MAVGDLYSYRELREGYEYKVIEEYDFYNPEWVMPHPWDISKDRQVLCVQYGKIAWMTEDPSEKVRHVILPHIYRTGVPEFCNNFYLSFQSKKVFRQIYPYQTYAIRSWQHGCGANLKDWCKIPDPARSKYNSSYDRGEDPSCADYVLLNAEEVMRIILIALCFILMLIFPILAPFWVWSIYKYVTIRKSRKVAVYKANDWW